MICPTGEEGTTRGSKSPHNSWTTLDTETRNKTYEVEAGLLQMRLIFSGLTGLVLLYSVCS